TKPQSAPAVRFGSLALAGAAGLAAANFSGCGAIAHAGGGATLSNASTGSTMLVVSACGSGVATGLFGVMGVKPLTRASGPGFVQVNYTLRSEASTRCHDTCSRNR